MNIDKRLIQLGEKWIRQYFELLHHGVTGMKHGVRNGPPYPIKRDGIFRSPKYINKKTKNGLIVTSFSKHVSDRINDENKPDRKVSLIEIFDAMENPIHIDDIRTDSEGKRSQRLIGEFATININPDNGVLTTLWKTGTKTREKYKNKKG